MAPSESQLTLDSACLDDGRCGMVSVAKAPEGRVWLMWSIESGSAALRTTTKRRLDSGRPFASGRPRARLWPGGLRIVFPGTPSRRVQTVYKRPVFPACDS